MLSLFLMTFVLIILVTMTVMVQVETSNSSLSLSRLRAQEAARLALMLAIGDLQKYAGPDQRVTARADILGDGNYAPEAKFWTGVWDTTNPTSAPKWLVSGDTPTPASAPTDKMLLVGEGSIGSADTTKYIYAPSISILNNDGFKSDEIAWWIADEGIKVSIGGLPLNLSPNTNFLEADSIRSLDLQIASTTGIEAIFTSFDRFFSESGNQLDKIYGIEQLLTLDDFSDPLTWSVSSEAIFHSLTLGSYGVLSNVLPGADGGLMRDLSLFPAQLGAEFEAYTQLGESFASIQNDAVNDTDRKRLAVEIRGLDDLAPLSNGDIATPIAPVLSNFMMAFTIRCESPVASNPNFYLRMRFFTEFWNPFTHTLKMEDGSGNPLNLELEVTGLPDIIVKKTTGSLDSSPPISIQDITSDPSNSDNAMVIKLVNDSTEDWLPGRSKNWTGVDASLATGRSPYYSKVTDLKEWDSISNTLGGSKGIDTLIPRLSGDIRHESAGNTTLTVKIYLVNEAEDTKKLISILDGIEYEPVSTDPSGYSNTHSGAKFGYHFILRGPHFSENDPEYFRGLWLHDHDPRNPEPSFNPDWYLDNDPSIPSGSAYVPVKDGISPLPLPEPAQIFEPGNIETTDFRRLLDRSGGTYGTYYNALWQDAPLFEIPRERILTLASLQHLYFHNERPYQVGNSWGSNGVVDTSNWFDIYYFSGLSRNDSIDNYNRDARLPNPTLELFNEDQFLEGLPEWQLEPSNSVSGAQMPAEQLIVRNRFNLNSTSVAAWKSILSSLRIQNLEYLDYPETDTSDLSGLTMNTANIAGAFSRFSNSLEETFESPMPPSFVGAEPVAQSSFYRHGARRIESSDYEALATEIVRLIKEKQKPFTSMSEFISVDAGGEQSLLEKAIASVFAPSGLQKWDNDWEMYGVNGDQSEIVDVDHFSPGFLTQADVLTAIGPILSPRSDTFKIRAKGRSYSKLGGQLSEVTIEATIQRIPEPLDSLQPINASTDRRFQIISMQWIPEDKI